jgi:hypothetical protein
MTLVDRPSVTSSRRAAGRIALALLKEIALRHAAWQELQRLRRLDRDALRDMGLTEADRASVTVAQIAARMRR